MKFDHVTLRPKFLVDLHLWDEWRADDIPAKSPETEDRAYMYDFTLPHTGFGFGVSWKRSPKHSTSSVSVC